MLFSLKMVLKLIMLLKIILLQVLNKVGLCYKLISQLQHIGLLIHKTYYEEIDQVDQNGMDFGMKLKLILMDHQLHQIYVHQV